jgi:hypothetical protein
MVAALSRVLKHIRNRKSFTVFWGTDPILNNYHWSQATKAHFTQSIFITRVDSHILNGRADKVLFSERKTESVLSKSIRSLHENLIFAITFMKVLIQGNLVCMSCDGFIFQNYKSFGFNHKLEFYLLRLAKISICVMPYGADAYVYSKVQDKNWLYGLLVDYPSAGRNQKQIGKKVDFYVRKSDLFLPGAMLFDGVGRSDWITPSTLCVPVLKQMRKKIPEGDSLVVTHAPNHREVKGTRFIIQVLNELIDEGLPIELRLLEKKPNQEVIRVLAEESDVHIDQLFFDGYALNALESMSLGVPTIGNFSGSMREFFDRWSFTAECPIIVANEKTLAEVLRNLCNDREYLKAASLKSIEYVQKNHSYEYFGERFSNLIHTFSPEYRRWVSKY